MAKLVSLYGHPEDPAAFEDYANRDIPYATDRMPNVIGAENPRVIGAPDADPPPYYRARGSPTQASLTCRPESGHGPGGLCWPIIENFATGGATILICEEA
jgi:hypothetical protein